MSRVTFMCFPCGFMFENSAKCAGKSIKRYGNINTSLPDVVQVSVSEFKQTGSQEENTRTFVADVPFHGKNAAIMRRTVYASINFYKNRKIELKQLIDSNHYQKCKKTKTQKDCNKNKTEYAIKKQTYRRKKAEDKNYEAIRKQEYRKQMRKIQDNEDKLSTKKQKIFQNRTAKHRALKKLQNVLPKTPDKRQSLIQTYLNNKNSPTVKALINSNVVVSPKERESDALATCLLEDLNTVIGKSKWSRSSDALKSLNSVVASVSGESIESSRKKKILSKMLGVSTKRVRGGKRIRTQILKGEKSCWDITKARTRSDTISVGDKKTAYEFWLQPTMSRPTGNKKDIKRQRTGPKQYTSHMIHVLEKTQVEVYNDFKTTHPNIKMSLKSFERCKPFFVRAVRIGDRQTCCCRYHTEINGVFKRCMQFRRNIIMPDTDVYEIYENVSSLCEDSLCPTEGYSTLPCLKRECLNCGVNLVKFHPEELDLSESADMVQWEKFEYCDVKGKGGKITRKLTLVKRETAPGEMFIYLKQLLETFPFHQHKVRWQHEQFRYISENLPLGTCVCVHDFSENYKCSEKKELQSTYFQKSEVTIHVSVLHRHSSLLHDGVESTPDNPVIIQDYFYVISPDLQHDQYFVQEIRQQIRQYLDDIGCTCHNMHEFTDGCASQYKSRHCFGEISNAEKLGYTLFTRSFFETSHAKGPQDAAGGLLKRQADLAVLRGACLIQTADHLYKFATENLESPKTGEKKRIFRYISSVNRESEIRFTPVSEIRSVHHVRVHAHEPGKVYLTELSCFTCDSCVEGDFDFCERHQFVGKVRQHQMIAEGKDTHNASNDFIAPEIAAKHLVSQGHVVALFTDDPSCDYYLMKVTKPLFISDKTTKDQWGATIPSNTEMFGGLYYDKTENTLQTYTLINKRTAVVPAASLLLICAQLDSKNILTIPEDLHMSIIDCAQMSQC